VVIKQGNIEGHRSLYALKPRSKHTTGRTKDRKNMRKAKVKVITGLLNMSSLVAIIEGHGKPDGQLMSLSRLLPLLLLIFTPSRVIE
jgi:hypothetical protein